MVFGTLARWLRNAGAKRPSAPFESNIDAPEESQGIRSLAALEAKVDALERNYGYGYRHIVPVPIKSPVEHIKDAPLETKEFWVKQINHQRLEKGSSAALNAAFVGFADSPTAKKRKTEFSELMSAHLKLPFQIHPEKGRRWAGDPTLPRGRYYSLCDEGGDDVGTLIGELRAYYTPERVGVVQMLDLTAPEDAAHASKEFGIPAHGQHILLFSFPPVNGRANPFGVSLLASQSGLTESQLAPIMAHERFLIELPLTVRKIRRERVFDLRQPDSAAWLARTLSSLEWQTTDQLIRCFPQRPSLERFADLLPELLAQERGGGGPCGAGGLLLRFLGADGVIFPSARNDTLVAIDDGGKIVGHRGWNFVDYAGASPPEYFAWIENGKQWPTQVGFRPYPDAAETDAPIWYPEIAINFASNGSWQVQGLRRRTNSRWRMALLRYALDTVRDDLSEETWGTLRTYPEVATDGGHINVGGMLAELIFDAVLGLPKVDEQLAAMGQQLRAWTPLQESIAELLDKVHKPSRTRWETMRSNYLRNQGHIDDDLSKMSP